MAEALETEWESSDETHPVSATPSIARTLPTCETPNRATGTPTVVISHEPNSVAKKRGFIMWVPIKARTLNATAKAY